MKNISIQPYLQLAKSPRYRWFNRFLEHGSGREPHHILHTGKTGSGKTHTLSWMHELLISMGLAKVVYLQVTNPNELAEVLSFTKPLQVDQYNNKALIRKQFRECGANTEHYNVRIYVTINDRLPYIGSHLLESRVAPGKIPACIIPFSIPFNQLDQNSYNFFCGSGAETQRAQYQEYCNVIAGKPNLTLGDFKSMYFKARHKKYSIVKGFGGNNPRGVMADIR